MDRDGVVHYIAVLGQAHGNRRERGTIEKAEPQRVSQAGLQIGGAVVRVPQYATSVSPKAIRARNGPEPSTRLLVGLDLDVGGRRHTGRSVKCDGEALECALGTRGTD